MGDIWGYNDGNGRLKADYKSSQTGVIYPAGTNISLVIINDTETKKILDAAAAEQKKKRAAAAAKAWGDAQASAGSKAVLREFKAADAYQKALDEAEAAKKAALAAAAQASAQQAHVAAIKAQTAEIRANTARNIAAQENPVEYAFNFLNDHENGVPAQEAARAAMENAKMQEETNYLPEVQVKSDFSKYLLWGGVAVLAFYLLKKKNW